MITTDNKKVGWLDRLKNGLHRTRVNIIGLFTGGKVDEDFLEELEFALISADMGVSTAGELLTRLRDTIQLKGLKTQEEVRDALREELITLLRPAEGQLNIDRDKPLVMMMVGVNGAGKRHQLAKSVNGSQSTIKAFYWLPVTHFVPPLASNWPYGVSAIVWK